MIIGLTAKARSGKDQFGEYLIKCFEDNHDRIFIKTAFADELKQMCSEQFGLSFDQLWGDKKEIPDDRFIKPIRPFCTGLGKDDLPNSYWTPREIMQEIGSFYRKIDYGFWVRALDKGLSKSDYKDFIITDVRHINECEYVKNKGGILIHIIREDADKIHGMDHESETALNEYTNYDIEIDNNGTLDDLYKAAERTSDAIVTIERMMKKGEVYNG
jgi:hypothetical protein